MAEEVKLDVPSATEGWCREQASLACGIVPSQHDHRRQRRGFVAHQGPTGGGQISDIDSRRLPVPSASRAKEIVSGKCFICHGADGESSSPVFPRLAGQHAAYVARQLADYKSGRRQSSMMQPMVDDLGPADFKALGAYLESRPVHVHAVDDPELASVGRFVYQRGNPYSGVAACAGCHGAAAHGTESLPRLAGQHAQYTEAQLKQFNKRERSNDNAVMQSIASKLTELEMKAVAAYLSGLK